MVMVLGASRRRGGWLPVTGEMTLMRGQGDSMATTNDRVKPVRDPVCGTCDACPDMTTRFERRRYSSQDAMLAQP